MPELTLDHVIIGVADPDAGAAALGHVLGRTPSWRGRHPAYGTVNVLFRLDNAYLELLAPAYRTGRPDPEATTQGAGGGEGQGGRSIPTVNAWTGSLGRFLTEKGEGLFSVALATADVAATVAGARSRGLTVEDPAEGDGVDLDTQAIRRWSNARIPPELTRGTRAFFIEHRSPPDALSPAALVDDGEGAVTEVFALGIESEDVTGARSMWRDVFALPETPGGEEWRYDLGNARLILSAGYGTREAPDRWAILILRVASLDAVRARLGVDYEDATYSGRPGLLLTCCGASVFLTEAM